MIQNDGSMCEVRILAYLLLLSPSFERPSTYSVAFYQAIVDKFSQNSRRLRRYPMHIMVGLAVALLLANVVVRFWPNTWGGTDARLYDMSAREEIQLEEIQQTKQEKKRPPPPRPIVPVIIPNEEDLEIVELDLDNNMLAVEDPGTDEEFKEGADETSQSGARADRGPQPRRIVEPTYPRAADRRNIRAEVVVRVLVNKRGRVDNVEVAERWLLEKDTARRLEQVDEIGYGIEEAALETARQWMFSPARENGEFVASYTVIAIRFGV